MNNIYAFLLVSNSHNHKPVAIPSVGVPQQHTVSLTPDVAKVLRTISSSLRPRDRKTLMADYTWDKDDNLTNTMKRNKDMVLAVVLLKEIQKRNQLVDCGMSDFK